MSMIQKLNDGIKQQRLGNGNILRCLAKCLIYYTPEYKANRKCSGCNQDVKCWRVVLALRGDSHAKK